MNRKLMTLCAYLGCGLMMFAMTASGAESEKQALSASYQDYHRRDMAALEQAFNDPADKQITTSAETHYAHAYRAYRLAVLHLQVQSRQTDDWIEKARDEFELWLKSWPETATDAAAANAILSNVLGMEIGQHPFRGLWLGGRTDKYMAKAEKLLPQSGTVLLLKAINLMHTPKSFGGGADRAEAVVQQAIARFQQQEEAHGFTLADAYFHAALIAHEKGDAKARDASLAQALSRGPDSQVFQMYQQLWQVAQQGATPQP